MSEKKILIPEDVLKLLQSQDTGVLDTITLDENWLENPRVKTFKSMCIASAMTELNMSKWLIFGPASCERSVMAVDVFCDVYVWQKLNK